MNKTLLSTLSLFTVLMLAGCQPAAPADEEGGAPSATKSSEATPPKPEAGAEEKSPEAASATLAKCDGCGMEVPKADLTAHDGKMLCKHCMEGHQHE